MGRLLSSIVTVVLLAGAINADITRNAGEDQLFRSYGVEYASCHLTRPDGQTLDFIVGQDSTLDRYHFQATTVGSMINCDITVTNLQVSDSGVWVIYGTMEDGFKGEETPYLLTVIAAEEEDDNSLEVDNNGDNEVEGEVGSEVDSQETEGPAETAMTSISVVRDRAVDLLVGPAEAIYCKLEDPLGHVVFDGFSRCHLSLEKVTLDHHGAWKMSVGYTGRVLLDEQQLYMTVLEADSKPVVTTHVEKERPLVRVSCSIATDASILGCKFRDGHGNILLANGNSEDRFSFEGGASASGYSCGLVINDPLVSDLGLWRCAIDTSEGTYYGFLDMLCPWALADPVVAATVQQVPVLAAERALVSAVSEEPVTVSCNVQSAIRYCYFRAPNGTTFTVNPTSPSSNMEYVGAGFEAGECGLRFLSMGHTDSGRWSCHVGLVGDLEEQRDQFQLTVHERMTASQHTIHGGATVVEGLVHEGRALEYCRFVRIDGFGFTSENVPSQYQFTGLLGNGECTLRMPDATILDMHPWTIVAKIQGHDAEISRDTLSSSNLSPPEEEVHPEVPGIEIINVGRSGVDVFLIVALSVAATALIVGASFTSKKNRQWASQRVSSLRNSFRGNKPDRPPQYPSNDQQYA